MDYEKTLEELKHMKAETGSFVCLGCGHEHNCSIHGCAILRDAVECIEELKRVLRESEAARADLGKRLVVLPQKTVWELTMDAGPACDMKCPVDAWDESLGCDLCSKAKQFAYERPCTQERLKELGKTVFLTREEAEAALAGKGGEG